MAILHFRFSFDCQSSLYRACSFQKIVLPFAEQTHTLEYEGGSVTIPAVHVSVGTTPPNSTWAMNPLPYSSASQAPQFAPPCDEPVDRTKSDTGRCSGRDPFNTLIADVLTVPMGIPAGDYVLGFR